MRGNWRGQCDSKKPGETVRNSLIIATLATAISLVLGLPTAYSIAKYRQNKIGIIILIARMTPFVILSYLLPWYIIFRYPIFHQTGTIWSSGIPGERSPSVRRSLPLYLRALSSDSSLSTLAIALIMPEVREERVPIPPLFFLMASEMSLADSPRTSEFAKLRWHEAQLAA
jgi:ABC-type glycerol-3-phosphate transport system permease component